MLLLLLLLLQLQRLLMLVVVVVVMSVVAMVVLPLPLPTVAMANAQAVAVAVVEVLLERLKCELAVVHLLPGGSAHCRYASRLDRRQCQGAHNVFHATTTSSTTPTAFVHRQRLAFAVVVGQIRRLVVIYGRRRARPPLQHPQIRFVFDLMRFWNKIK